MSQETYYITTAIAYVNGRPHIGHAMEMLQAECLARYNRLIGNDTYFLTGTDEFGSKVYKTAEDAGISVEKLVDQNVIPFQELTTKLNLSHDQFIRTSSAQHRTGAQKLWQKLVDNNDIYKDTYEGLYCIGCETYLGPKELEDGKCAIHKKEPELIKEENYFFKLSKYNDQIKELITSDKLKIHPEARRNEILAQLERGLHDISFSRPKSALPWGVEVPNDSDHVMYVWCDALSNYITALDFEHDSALFQKYWPAQMQVIGKDILRFHAGIWIGMLLAAKLPIPEAIGVHGFMTSEGHKMSKSLGNVIDPFDIIDQYGVDPVRYYLLKEIPTADDGDFNHDRFKEVHQSDLANNLGNLFSRVTAMLQKYNDGKTLELKASEALTQSLETAWQTYHHQLKQFDLKKAAEAIMQLLDFGNKYIEQNQPWTLAKTEPEHANQILTELIELLRHSSIMLTPYLPQTAAVIQERLNYVPTADFQTSIKTPLPQGHEISKGESLFPRIES